MWPAKGVVSALMSTVEVAGQVCLPVGLIDLLLLCHPGYCLLRLLLLHFPAKRGKRLKNRVLCRRQNAPQVPFPPGADNMEQIANVDGNF